MSERTIKFIYKGEEKIVNIFANFEECKKAFDIFDIEHNDEQKEKLRKFYIYLLFSYSSKSKNEFT